MCTLSRCLVHAMPPQSTKIEHLPRYASAILRERYLAGTFSVVTQWSLGFRCSAGVPWPSSVGVADMWHILTLHLRLACSCRANTRCHVPVAYIWLCPCGSHVRYLAFQSASRMELQHVFPWKRFHQCASALLWSQSMAWLLEVQSVAPRAIHCRWLWSDSEGCRPFCLPSADYLSVAVRNRTNSCFHFCHCWAVFPSLFGRKFAGGLNSIFAKARLLTPCYVPGIWYLLQLVKK